MRWRDAAESLQSSRFKKNKIVSFVAEVFVELDSTTWPTKDEVMNSTVIVLITVAFFTTYLGIVDYFLSILQSSFYRFLESQLMSGIGT